MAAVPAQPWDEWVAELFEYEFCENCGGDAAHHEPRIVLGNWFAYCRFPPDEETGEWHPFIKAYHSNDMTESEIAHRWEVK